MNRQPIQQNSGNVQSIVTRQGVYFTVPGLKSCLAASDRRTLGLNMRRSENTPNPAQCIFAFEEMSLPASFAREARGRIGLPIAPPAEYIPLYDVFLRRSDVLAVRERPTIRSPTDAAAVVWECVKESDREKFVVLLLDTKNGVIGATIVSVGILDSALVHPREVFKPAILCNAAAIILSHNHPSGDPNPSPEDRRVTQRIHEAGTILGIEVLDHVIVGGTDNFVSLKERGVI